MAGVVWTGAARALAVCTFGGFIWQATVTRATAETLLEHSAEVRMQLDFVVSDAALKTFLPDGWVPNPTTSGAGKDCNLRMIFIDRVDVTKPDGSSTSPTSAASRARAARPSSSSRRRIRTSIRFSRPSRVSTSCAIPTSRSPTM